jgi:hypothetical protein
MTNPSSIPADNQQPKCIGTNAGQLSFSDLALDGSIAGAMLRNGHPFSASDHYVRLITTGKFAGGTTNRCPGTYQIICGKTPTTDVGFIVISEDGDLVLSAPSGRVRIIGEDVDIQAIGGGTKKGNINIFANNNIKTSGKTVESIASAALKLSSGGNCYLNISNILYKSAAFTKNSTAAAVSLPPTFLSNTGVSEIRQTLQKILSTFL